MNPAKKYPPLSLSVLACLFIWGITAMPSGFFPYWSYLDDPTNLLTARDIATHFHFPRPDGFSGRFFPAYQLYYAALYGFFGFKLSAYYLVQSLSFLMVLFLALLITVKLTGSYGYGILSVFLLATVSPMAENLYTLGKAEPRILLLLFLAIWLTVKLLFSCQAPKNIWMNRLNVFVIFLLVFIAILTKETALVFFVFAFSGFLLLKILKDREALGKNPRLKLFLSLSILSALAFAITRLLYFILSPKGSLHTYTSYPVTIGLIVGNLKFYLSQQPDVFLLGMIAAFLLIRIVFQDGRNRDNVLIAGSLFFAALAYIVMQLLWRWPLGYYLLVPAAFFAVALVIALGELDCEAGKKKLILCCLSLVLLSRFYTIPYLIYIARAQKAKDQVYTEAVEAYLEKARPGERLLVEDWPFYAEPVNQTNILIRNILQKKRFKVEGIHDLIHRAPVPATILKLYNVDRLPDNQARVPRKGDYLLSFYGDNSMPWRLRGVSPFLKDAGSDCRQTGPGLSEVSARELQWKSLGLDARKLPVMKTYTTGYTLYKVRFHKKP